MKHFFVDQSNIYDTYILIEGTDVNHICNVLRMQNGDDMFISDGLGNDYICKLSEINEDYVKADIIEKGSEGTELRTKFYLFQGLPKADKMELIIQKAVELGAYEIIPVEMNRSIVKLDDKKKVTKQQRWQAISQSAAKQSRRAVIPEIKQVMNYKNALEYAKTLDIIIVPYENYNDMSTFSNILYDFDIGSKIGIFIGPEGGFEDYEIEESVKNNAKLISLGRRILRTETAGMAILSAMMLSEETRTK